MHKLRTTDSLSDFENWIDEADREKVIERLSGIVRGHVGPDAYAHEMTWACAGDCTLSGSIRWKGREHGFTIRIQDGDVTEILAWNRGSRFTLAPFETIVADAINKGRAAELLQKWDDLVLRGDVLAMVRRFDHARFIDQGSDDEMKWRDRAASLGFAIVSPQEALRIHKRLEIQAAGFVSTRTGTAQSGAELPAPA
jgi:hypothetical protein